MIRPTPGMGCTNGGVCYRLLDDAQVLAVCPNHLQHVAIKPSMKAVVKERLCTDFNVE